MATGAVFIAGCGDAADAPSIASRQADGRASLVRSDCDPRQVKSTATSGAIDDRSVRPVWFPFEDPPLPSLQPADGSGTGVTAGAPPKSNPISETAPVAPRRDVGPITAEEVRRDRGATSTETANIPRGEFRRLPPVDDGAADRSPFGGDENDVAPPARYVVDSPYSLGSPPEGQPGRRGPRNYRDDSEARPADVHRGSTNDAIPIERPIRLPAVSPAPNDSSSRGTDAYRRARPPVDAAISPRHDETLTHLPKPSGVAEMPSLRPSALAAAEARPLGRFTRLPPVDEAPPSMPSIALVEPPSVQSVVKPPIAAKPLPRNRDMDLIADRANQCVRKGYELANRGALYSAETEFVKALRLVAQALDAESAESTHAQALAAGLVALEESDDFLSTGSPTAAPLDLAAVVAKHRTTVLKDVAIGELTPIVALQRYFSYAQEQLAIAAEHETSASAALFALGKIQTTLAATKTGGLADGPKAIALHQAALLVDDKNHMAANELGVLLARCGRYDMARSALQHSVSVSPTPAAWRNLATVHERLGEGEMAARARTQADVCAKSPPPAAAATSIAGPQQPIVWMDPNAFAQSARPETDLQSGHPGKTAAAPATQSNKTQTSDKKSFLGWPLK